METVAGFSLLSQETEQHRMKNVKFLPLFIAIMILVGCGNSTIEPQAADPSSDTQNTETDAAEPELAEPQTEPITEISDNPISPIVSDGLLAPEEAIPGGQHPTIADVWDRTAGFVIEQIDTGLPRGESETVIMPSGEWFSYLHASDLSAGAIDQCGDHVQFPGCVVIYRSTDGGMTFSHDEPPVCQLSCHSCPCDSLIDHIDQQQYPDTFYHEETQTLYMVYEYRGQIKLWTSQDGVNFGNTQHVGQTGAWSLNYLPCSDDMRINPHPYEIETSDCLAGAPPGIFIEGNTAYVFVGFGKNPGKMGCFKGSLDVNAKEWGECDNILIRGAEEYGDPNLIGNAANPYFDFKTISSAEVVALGEGEDRRYYMLYEGIRGAHTGDRGDTQFGLGMARSKTNQIDGEWEKYPGNPLLVDIPANVGIGHADIIVENGITYVYTSINSIDRTRMRIAWLNN